MKTSFVLSILLVCSAVAARAELLLYNLTGTQVVLGLGAETLVRPSGVLVWDVDTGQARQFTAFRVGTNRLFTVTDRSGDLTVQSAGRARTWSAVIGATNLTTAAGWSSATSFTWGLNSPLLLRPSRTVSFPRAARSTGYALGQTYGQYHFGPTTGFYSYSAARTLPANAAGQTLADALALVRARYVALGFTEVVL